MKRKAQPKPEEQEQDEIEDLEQEEGARQEIIEPFTEIADDEEYELDRHIPQVKVA